MTILRKNLTEELRKRAWFKATSTEVKKQLLALPQDCDGFLKDIAGRPEEIGNIRMIKMVKLLAGNYILTPIFEVEAIQTKQKYTFEYASWKYGSTPGKCRGIVFLEEEGKIKYFAVRRSDRFSISRTVYDALGARYTDDKNQNLSVSAKMESHLKRVLKLRNVDFKRIVDLGVMYSDTGLSNVSTQLFAAIIDTTNHAEEVIRYIKSKKFDRIKTQSEAEIFPIEDIIDFANKTDDSFLLSTISRCFARGIINDL